jgi:hypothetical protein
VQSCFWYADPGNGAGKLPLLSFYCPTGVQYARDTGQSIEVGGAPIPGDIVFFSWEMSEWPRWRAGTGDHVGIVESWDGGDWITTIEGNIGNPQGVHRVSRSISGTVINFWRPNVFIDGGSAPAPLKEEEDLTPQQEELLLHTHARTTYIWENLGRLLEMADRMAVIWPLITGMDPVLRDTFNRADWTHAGVGQANQKLDALLSQKPVEGPDETDEPSAPDLPVIIEPVPDGQAHEHALKLNVAEVKEIQSLLVVLGYPLLLTGILDDDTVKGVRWFQQGAELPVTGVVDQTTSDRMRQVVNQLLGDSGANQFEGAK